MKLVAISNQQYERRCRRIEKMSLRHNKRSLTATSIASAAQRHYRTVREVLDDGNTLIVNENWRNQLSAANQVELGLLPVTAEVSHGAL